MIPGIVVALAIVGILTLVVLEILLAGVVLEIIRQTNATDEDS